MPRTVPARTGAPHPAAREHRRLVRSWLLYDAANSVFVTTVTTALGGPFLTALATAAASPSGHLGVAGLSLRAGSLYAYVTSLSVLLQVLTLPLLGALADTPRGRHRLLVGGTLAGSAAAAGFALVPAGGWLLAAALLTVANVAYGAALVSYNALLADVAAPADRDAVSSRGFAVGYVGGGLLLAVALAALEAAPALGVTRATVARGSMLAAALCWAALGLVSARGLAPLHRGAAPAAGRGPRLHRRLTTSGHELAGALRDLRALPQTARYLLAFLLFNDAVQAVVALSAVFVTQELFVAHGRPADDATGFLLTLVLLIQFVAIAGALLFARLAARWGAKNAILASLVGWVAVVVYCYAGLRTQGQAYAAGAAIALVLGGSQALARSLFSRMVPASRQSSFFSFYELAERGTAWIGTLTFAVVLDVTGSYRQALLSLLVLFVAGGLLLVATDTDEAVRAAQAHDAGGLPDPAPAPSRT